MEGKSIYDLCFDTFEEAIVLRALVMRRVRVPVEEVRKITNIICNYVKLFSMLDEYDDMLDDRSLDKWPVLDEFSGMVQPASVKFIAGDVRCQDLIDHRKVDMSCSFDEYINAITEFRSWRKHDAVTFIKDLKQLKVNLSVNDVLFKIVDPAKRVSFNGEVYAPIILSNPGYVGVMMKNFVYNTSVETLIKEYSLSIMK